MIKIIIQKVLKLFSFEYKYGSLIYIKNRRGNVYNKLHNNYDGNNRIAELLNKMEPFLVSRLGSTELQVILNFLNFKNRKKVFWNEYLKDEIQRQSGVFPTDDLSMNKFSQIYLDSIKSIDVLGVWYNDGEDFIIEKYCPKAELVPLTSLEPYFFVIPWSLFLAKKRVLVIHPFTESIELQYKLRENLFSNTKVLPEFNLLTLKCPQTHVYNQTGFESWFEVLQNLKNKIEKIEFDVAIIGAGAYGLPLASFVKELGKHAIHIGGATQILFGIKGKRWEDRKEFHSFFNEYWKSPLETEKPKNYKSLEEGAYW